MRQISRLGAAVGLTALLGTAVGCTPAEVQAWVEGRAKPCQSTYVEGHGDVVTFNSGDLIGCDVVPPQHLHIVYWVDGSASGVAAAQSDCDHSGSPLVWIGTTKLVCESDY